jgi:hypothetical protein
VHQVTEQSPDRWFQIRIVDELGHTVEAAPTAVAPLALEDILRACSTTDRTLQLKFATDAAMVDGKQVTGNRTLAASISFHQPLRIYALVRGGWVPPPLVIPPMFLVDRNIVATLRQFRRGQRRQDSAELEWWIDLLAGGRAWFNPLPSAMESGERRTPTLDEFVAEFHAASKELAVIFPEARIIAFEQRHFEAAYQIVKALERRTGAEAGFLLEAAPMIAHPVAPHSMFRVKEEIMRLARKHLARDSPLVLVAAFSCLYGDDDLAIGRGVLKPTGYYSLERAHNALSDLRLIELAAISQGLSELGTFSLCTRDRSLALFWCGVAPQFVAWQEQRPSINLILDRRLFPRLKGAELDELVLSLQQYGVAR